MDELKFRVIGQELIVEKFKEKIVANSVNYLKASIEFEELEDWNNLLIYAEFCWDRKNYWTEIKDGVSFFVPWEVIKVPGFTVSIFGTKTKIDHNGDTKIEKQITTNLVPILVESSGDLTGVLGDQEGNELNVYVMAKQALDNSEKALQYAQDSVNKVNEISTQINQIYDAAAQATAIQQDFSEFKTQTETSFSSLQKETKSQSEKIEKNIKDISELKENLSAIDFDINFQEKEIEAINQQLTQIEEDQIATGSSFSAVAQKLEDISQNLRELNLADIETGISLSKIEGDITSLSNGQQAINQEIINIKDSILGLEENSNQLVGKEDVDFIFHTNLILNQNPLLGALDLTTGQTIESEDYYYYDYIPVQQNIVSTLSGFNVCYYTRVEEEITDELGGVSVVTSYSFLSGETVMSTIVSIPEGADTIRISIVAERVGDLLVQNGTVFKERYDYYSFDESLTQTIQFQIENTIGSLINADY